MVPGLFNLYMAFVIVIIFFTLLRLISVLFSKCSGCLLTAFKTMTNGVAESLAIPYTKEYSVCG